MLNRHQHSLLQVLVLLLLALSAMAEDKPSIELNWYGYVKLDGAFDQNPTSHGNFVMWVKPTTLDKNNGQFNMTANETRFGVSAKGKNYGEFQLGAKLEFDLYASLTGTTIAENKAMLQLRHAFFTVQKGSTKLLAGQSWDIVSPLNPSTLNYPVMWGSGNIGYRRPQVSLWQSFKAGASSDVTLAAGVFRTIGSDITPTLTLATGETSDGLDDGTTSGMPTVEGILEVKTKSASGLSFQAGISGLYGKMNAKTSLGQSQEYSSDAVVGHLSFATKGGHGFAAEAYSGSNLKEYFGGALNNNTINGVKSTGGWISAWIQASPKLKISSGIGIDNPDDEDLANGSRSKNRSVYGNLRYQVVAPVTLGFEVADWKTSYKSADSARDLRVQSSLILNF